MFCIRQCAIYVLSVENRIPSLGITARNFKRWVAPTLRELKRRKDKMGPQPLQHRSTFLEWNYHAELFAFGKRLNENFDGKQLQKALTHRSYIVQEEIRQQELGIPEPKLSLEDNQKLVQEGEELMNHYIKQYLRTSLPLLPEEGICAVHDWLTSDKVMANISSHIGTKDLILTSDFPVGEATLATTLKAVVGALLHSSGIGQARLFVRDFVLTQLAGQDINDFWTIKEPMAVVQDILARGKRGVPEARLIHEAGKNTILAAYQVGLYSDREHIGTGSGENVEVATEMAARDVLRRIFNVVENMKPISFKLNISSTDNKNMSLEEWKSENIVHCN